MSERETNSDRRRALNAGPSGRGQFDSGSRQTLADLIYDKLHHDITNLILPPGTPIQEREIAETFNASRTPVREAVLRLSKERLVEVVPKSGTFVARIPLSVLPEALVARRALECDLVARAAARSTPSQRLRLRAIIEDNREAAASRSQQLFDATDSAFHAEIAAMSGYPGLWALIKQIKTPMDRHRHLTLPVPGRMDQVVMEHTAIADAIEQGDVELAAQQMDRHLSQLKRDTSETVKRHPTYFIFDIEPSSLCDD